MADTPISMPKLGMSMEEGKVVTWPFPLGSHVSKGQIVLIIESEKAEVEIEATGTGYLRHIYVEPEETVPCGSLLAALTEEADGDFDVEAFHALHHNPEAPAEASPEVQTERVRPSEARAPGAKVAVTPAARALAKRLGVDPTTVAGTGPKGRVTKEDIEAAASQAQEGLTEVAPGVGIEVLNEGSGPALVLLPGFGSDGTSFAPQTSELTGAFDVHVVHPRGVGRSMAPGEEPIPVPTIAADAAAAVSGPVHVVGASLGAAAAIEWALSDPERIKSLTLITPFVASEGRLASVLESWAEIASQGTPELLSSALLPWLFSGTWLRDDKARERTERGLAAMLRCASGEVLRRYVAGVASWSDSRRAALSDIRVPTLVIAAGEDLLTPDARGVAEAIPGAELCEIAGAGHAVCMESAAAVNAALLAHLSRHA